MIRNGTNYQSFQQEFDQDVFVNDISCKLNLPMPSKKKIYRPRRQHSVDK